MKVSHKINHGWAPDRTDPDWAARVEREAERTTDAAEQAWRRTQERYAQALARAEAEESGRKPDRKKVKRLWAAVEARRQELLDLQRMAQRNPGGPQRHRPVPNMRAL